jgi:peroxiredoxin
MTLAKDLDAFRTGWESRVGQATARLVADDLAALAASGITARAARAGDPWPDAPDLLDAHGAPFDMTALLAQGPLVATFYRGGWCPYCNLELRAYQAALPIITAAGGRLVAISPERPDHSLTTAEKNDLTFPVVSDVGGALADALGIRFALSTAVQPFYEKAGHALPARNGDGTWALPIPATFVVGRDGRIALASIEPDYRRRLSPEAAIAALQTTVPPPPPLEPAPTTARHLTRTEDSMTKIAIVIYSRLEGAGKSAVYRGLMFADELMRSGDDVAIVFDGAGASALADLLDPANSLHRTWMKAAPALRGVCAYCAKSYGVHDALTAASVPMLTDDKGHASLRQLLVEGRQIVTF